MFWGLYFNCQVFAILNFLCYGKVQQEVVIQTTHNKVKNDHRSKYSNLSNWKEEA